LRTDRAKSPSHDSEFGGQDQIRSKALAMLSATRYRVHQGNKVRDRDHITERSASMAA
jgi:hypothetical protein